MRNDAESTMRKLSDEQAMALLSELAMIPGGYKYSGICSFQVCFPLRNGGELRFSVVDDDMENAGFSIDLYDGALPPGITGPSKLTGEA